MANEEKEKKPVQFFNDRTHNHLIFTYFIYIYVGVLAFALTDRAPCRCSRWRRRNERQSHREFSLRNFNMAFRKFKVASGRHKYYW